MDLGVATYKLQLIQGLLVEQGYEIPAYLYGYCAPAEAAHQVELLRSLCSQNPQAIVCNIEALNEQGLIELRRYQEAGGVLVTYDFPIDLDCDRVLFYREDNTYQATRHLLEIGHRDIALCMPGDPRPVGPRLQGFCRALREFGEVPRNEWLFGSETHGHWGSIYEEAGVTLSQHIMKMKNPPTALCVLDDATASACGAEFERGGWRVPADISIVGHDDSPIARYGALQLTTVIHPAEAIAHNVIDLLRERLLKGPGAPAREVVLRGNLVVRKSTSPPRQRK
jgi:DNA-binding LacI/PurR family transcriptional regulator